VTYRCIFIVQLAMNKITGLKENYVYGDFEKLNKDNKCLHFKSSLFYRFALKFLRRQPSSIILCKNCHFFKKYKPREMDLN
jgi:hypothetical protein